MRALKARLMAKGERPDTQNWVRGEGSKAHPETAEQLMGNMNFRIDKKAQGPSVLRSPETEASRDQRGTTPDIDPKVYGSMLPPTRRADNGQG